MAKKPVKYCVVDAFTDSALKGNPAAVCLLEEDRSDEWLQAVAREFNISETCYLTPITHLDSHFSDSGNGLLHSTATSHPKFRLRWFTPVAEVDLCGHATLAAAYFLFLYGFVKTDIIEFLTLSGILTARRVPDKKEGFFVELDFPIVHVLETNYAEIPPISKNFNKASVVEINKTDKDDLFVVLSSGEAVAGLQPQLNEIQKCPSRGVIVTGPAPPGSGFDFYSRFFCPKLGIPEDPVCGSAHCALASYWHKMLGGKRDFIAYAASPRSGVVNVRIDEENQRVFLQGKAIAVMEGSLLV
nr:phenazine biosynthesis-like domain-containing protein 1 [Ipomoea batatas]